MNRPRVLRLVPVLSVVLALCACTTTVSGTPVGQGSVVTTRPDEPGPQGGVDASFVRNGDGGEIDRLAATVVTDVRTFWEQTFPVAFGKPFKDLSGGYYSVDTSDSAAPTPPCAESAAEVEGNAYYCPDADMMAWDRAALLPVLKERFGEASVVLVLAHEMGHAVQSRSGIGMSERKSDPGRYPTILVEAMADCYAGAFVRWVTDGKSPHLRLPAERMDSALASLITFRDPVGTDQTDRGAHGDAFDRVSAFQDGFDQGVKLCAGMTVDNRVFTLSGFRTATEQANGGNLTFRQIFESTVPLLEQYYGGVVSQAGKQWVNPATHPGMDLAGCDGAKQGPIAYCAQGRTIEYDTAKELPGIHADIGDYATATLLSSRFGMAALASLGKPIDGQDAGRSAVCLSGAFAGWTYTLPDQFLSPGDLDEAVQVLLDYDYAARGVAGAAGDGGFERVREFRAGFTQGARKCGLS
ncbi:neutral zinc metallopeptidase [Actinokineospora enzanensis]|uniref:neutral zinc metallopeptidase n=1 Tax=Actinokineospora enzanensis TaxID=155975 RepID=UPI00146D8903|nr:neutral zinc metallopeptidase [Actinokineospora enzanensis]